MPFRDVVGHARLIDLLARSVAGGTLPPSLLLAGHAGIGKRLTAVAVAQALNCLEGSGFRVPGSGFGFGFDACGKCGACTRIARGVHPDVLTVQPGDSGAIKIDQVRDIVDRAAYRPFEGRRRVVIVDDADALVSGAQNALLKTLEEPPPSSVFMLVTARPDVLLPTVRSRCPQLRFRPLSASDIAQVLVARGYSESEARAVAATADGSVGRALEASASELVEARDIAQRVLARASTTGEAGRRLDSAKELLSGMSRAGAGGGAGDRGQLASHLRAMASLLRDVAVLATRADVRALANPDVRPALERLTQTYEGERGLRAFSAIDRALVALMPPHNGSVKIVADWLVLQL
jgi:DNA polymerase-3 subunit delta'